jgi:hypothetical protein
MFLQSKFKFFPNRFFFSREVFASHNFQISPWGLKKIMKIFSFAFFERKFHKPPSSLNRSESTGGLSFFDPPTHFPLFLFIGTSKKNTETFQKRMKKNNVSLSTPPSHKTSRSVAFYTL